MARHRPASGSLLGALALLIAAGLPVHGQDPAPSPDAQAPSPPRIGATVRPSKLTLPAEGTTQTGIRNAGSIPATVYAIVNLPGTRLPAVGWAVTVEPASLQPDQWATVTLALDGAPLGDVSLDVFMVPEIQGQEAMVLRFPIPVDVKGATTESTAAAWGASIAHRIASAITPFGTTGE
jgi:hypothetical protein